MKDNKQTYYMPQYDELKLDSLTIKLSIVYDVSTAISNYEDILISFTDLSFAYYFTFSNSSLTIGADIVSVSPGFIELRQRHLQ